MPNREVHCEFTSRKYSVTGEDIHRWMDAPARNLGVTHRNLRHGYDDWIPKKFARRYGLTRAKQIIRSHIWLDDNWSWYQKYF